MRWHRSLYWRIALGVVGFLAAMLVVQAVLFVWAVSQTGRTLPGQSPVRLAAGVALDLGNLLERDPQADVDKYVHDQYAQYTHPFFVLLTDGRVVTSGSTSFPEPLLRMAREQLDRRLERPEPTERSERWRFGRPDRAESARPDAPRSDLPRPEGPRADAPRPDDPRRDGALRGRGDAGDRGRLVPRGGERFDRPAGAAGFVRPAPILVNGELAGVVVVPPQAPFGFLLGRFAPMLALVAGRRARGRHRARDGDVFGPARRRLRALEAAAHRLGAGDLDGARARSRRRRNRRGGARVQRHGGRPRRRAPRHSPNPIACGASCSPTCRTS